MPEVTREQVCELAVRLGRFDLHPDWIYFPAWASPPDGCVYYVRLAAKLRQWASDILHGRKPMPEWSWLMEDDYEEKRQQALDEFIAKAMAEDRHRNRPEPKKDARPYRERLAEAYCQYMDGDLEEFPADMDISLAREMFVHVDDPGLTPVIVEYGNGPSHSGESHSNRPLSDSDPSQTASDNSERTAPEESAPVGQKHFTAQPIRMHRRIPIRLPIETPCRAPIDWFARPPPIRWLPSRRERAGFHRHALLPDGGPAENGRVLHPSLTCETPSTVVNTVLRLYHSVESNGGIRTEAAAA